MVRSKCKKVINLMRALVGKDWGANKQSLMYIYRALMRSTIVLRVGRGREPWERSEAGGVNGNERHLRHSPVSSPTEELRKG